MKEERYRGLQGTYPVISLSFANAGFASAEKKVWASDGKNCKEAAEI